MISAASFYGGGDFLNANAGTGTVYPDRSRGWVQSWGGGSGLSLRLPDARELALGGPAFLLFNVGANSWELRKNAGQLIATVAVDEAVLVCLVDGSDAAGTWTFKRFTVSSA